MNTSGGSAWLSFTKAPQTVQVTTGSGDAVLVLPGGPYAVRADSSGGPQLVSVPVSPTAASTVAVSTGGGELQVKPSAAGSSGRLSPVTGSRAGRGKHAPVRDDGCR